MEQVDHLVIGGGVYGTYVAARLAEAHPDHQVLLVEKEDELFSRASSHNHGRLHWGYQYPLHPETAVQSRRNVIEFTREYEDCINGGVESYYGIHKDSTITPEQYESFCESVELSCQPVVDAPDGLFGDDVVAVYRTEEATFSNKALQARVGSMLAASGAMVKTKTQVEWFKPAESGIEAITFDEDVILAKHVFNCTYSGINDLHHNSGVELIPSTHEKYALFTVKLPDEFRDVSATVIYGAFASMVSNNEVGSHVLAHVAHSNLIKSINLAHDEPVSEDQLAERFEQTVVDSHPYMPALEVADRTGAITEIKSVFGTNPALGERRVHCLRDYGGVHNYNVIFSGKMNCFYDAAAFALSTLTDEPVSLPAS